MASVSIKNAEKIYPNGHKAIRGINLEIENGEFVVLVGPSGCGKSTLLRMLAGLETITSGDIAIGDRIVNELEPAERDIAMVFQNYALYPHMSVYKNMAYGLKNKGTPEDEIKQRVNEAAEMLELKDLLDRKPRQLSGGQRQRVAMGRAIVRKPIAFLFDEPLSNLDAKLRVQMRLEIKKLQRKLGTTTIYVTHDQVEAMTMADRLVVMRDGIAEQIGSPMEVYTNPRTQFVGGFIGSPAMNFLPAKLMTDTGEVELENGLRFGLRFNPSVELTGLTTINIGIRPEHFQIAETGLIDIDVELIEPLGSESLLHGTLTGGTTRLTIKTTGMVDIKEGEAISLNYAPEHLYVFDAASGLQISPN
ncbi:MAG: ABC transporter ATP-binding protein [Arenicellales bacterium WSBS_2016_MAG_OTU3]